MDAREATLRAEFSGHDAPAAGAIRAVMAHFSAASTNWHPSAVYFAALAPEDADAGLGVRALLSSVLMAFFQWLVTMGMVVSTMLPSCATSDQCAQKGRLIVGRRSMFRCQGKSVQWKGR